MFAIEYGCGKYGRITGYERWPTREAAEREIRDQMQREAAKELSSVRRRVVQA